MDESDEAKKSIENIIELRDGAKAELEQIKNVCLNIGKLGVTDQSGKESQDSYRRFDSKED